MADGVRKKKNEKKVFPYLAYNKFFEKGEGFGKG